MIEKTTSTASTNPQGIPLSKDDIYTLLNQARFPDGAEDYPAQFDDGGHWGAYDIYNKENEMGSIDFEQIPFESKYLTSMGVIAQLQNVSYKELHPIQVLEKILNEVSVEDMQAIQITCKEGISTLQKFMLEKKPEHIASCVGVLDELIIQNKDNPQVIKPLAAKKEYLQQLTDEYITKQIALLQEIAAYIQTYKEMIDAIVPHATGEIKNELLSRQSAMKGPITTTKRNDKAVQIVKNVTAYEGLEAGAMPYGTFNAYGNSLPSNTMKLGSLLGRGNGSPEITELGKLQDRYLSEENDHRKMQLYKDANKKLTDILIFLTATENNLSDNDISKIAEEMPVDEFLDLPISEKYPAKTQFLLIRIYEAMVKQSISKAMDDLEAKPSLLRVFSKVNISEKKKQLETDRDTTLALLQTKKDTLNKVITRFNTYKADQSLYSMYAEFGLSTIAA